MVGTYAIKVSWAETETYRLWGRYFEFFAPLIWLSAAPAVCRIPDRRTAWACAGATLAGLAGLLICLSLGIRLFPWDSSLLTAFFQSDPFVAPLGDPTPYRLLAGSATLAAAIALVARVRPSTVGVVWMLALGALSTRLDGVWMDPVREARAALDRDLTRIAPAFAQRRAAVLLTADANDGPLIFLRLGTHVQVVQGDPAETPPERLIGADTVLVEGDRPPPGGPWRETFHGERIRIYGPAPEGT
jgi:hypothetical protein